MIKFTYEHTATMNITPTRQKRMEKQVAGFMEQGRGLSSASGWTAEAAIRWCVTNGRGFKLTVAPGGAGYYVEPDKA